MQVLFVEDDAMNRRVVKDMLTVVGVEMDEAADAETGLAMIDRADYDVILMDLRMPGMDGLTAIRHVRARTDQKGRVPIIVVTADSGEGLHDRCLSGGATQVIAKPVAMSALFDALGGAIAGSGDVML